MRDIERFKQAVCQGERAAFQRKAAGALKQQALLLLQGMPALQVLHVATRAEMRVAHPRSADA